MGFRVYGYGTTSINNDIELGRGNNSDNDDLYALILTLIAEEAYTVLEINGILTSTITASSTPLKRIEVIGDGSVQLDASTIAVGTLFLDTAFTLDFEEGDALMAFADSSAVGWSGSLDLINFTEGVDSLRFGSNAAGLCGAGAVP